MSGARIVNEDEWRMSGLSLWRSADPARLIDITWISLAKLLHNLVGHAINFILAMSVTSKGRFFCSQRNLIDWNAIIYSSKIWEIFDTFDINDTRVIAHTWVSEEKKYNSEKQNSPLFCLAQVSNWILWIWSVHWQWWAHQGWEDHSDQAQNRGKEDQAKSLWVF